MTPRKLLTPGCCPEMIDFASIIAVIDWGDCDLRGETSAEMEPEWRIQTFDPYWTSRHSHATTEEERKAGIVIERDSDGEETEYHTTPFWKLDPRPAPKFCPFCSASVPKLVRKKRPPKVQLVSDGGYYCDTCEQRVSECVCPYPEQAWEVER